MRTVYNVRVLTPAGTITQTGYEKERSAFVAFAYYAERPEAAKQASIIRVQQLDGHPDHTKQLAYFQRD